MKLTLYPLQFNTFTCLFSNALYSFTLFSISVFSLEKKSTFNFGNKKYSHHCHIMNKDDFIHSFLFIDSEQLTLIQKAYEDENCNKPYFELSQNYNYEQIGINLNLVHKKSYMTSFSDEVTRSLNFIHYCGLSDWKTNQATEVTGLNCDEFQNYKSDQKIYSILILDSKTLKMGVESLGYNGLTEEQRFQELESFEAE